MANIKALILFSGGLDSLLGVKILQAQSIEVTGVCFKSSFFSADKAKEAAKNLGIELKIVDISSEILELVKNPPSGYGRRLNPCIDCHSLMIKEAAKILKKERYDFIATGEVLGQRPFSQNKDALESVSKLSGTEVLRPLSAKLLGETEIEKKRLVNRGRLLNIRGRRRERQIELAKKYKLKEIPSPSGGCLLTDPGFSDRLVKMLDYWPDCSLHDINLLKNGRIFWFNQKDRNIKDRNIKTIIVIGRHLNDNENLEKLVKSGDIMLKLKEIVGPTTLIRIKEPNLVINKLEKEINKEINIDIPDTLKMSSLKLGEEKDFKEIIEIAALLTGYYSTKARGKNIVVNISIK